MKDITPNDPITKEQMYSALNEQMLESLKQFKDAKAFLKHGQKDRLIEAILLYPDVVEDFSSEQLELQQAYAAGCRVEDAKIAKTAEYVIEQLQLKQQEQQENNNG